MEFEINSMIIFSETFESRGKYLEKGLILCIDSKRVNDVITILNGDNKYSESCIRWTMTCCIMNGYVNIVKLLLMRDDLIVHSNLPLLQAIENGRFEIVKLLISDLRIDPSICCDYALERASYNGYYSIAKLLIADSRVHPSNINNCIYWAQRNRHHSVVELLENFLNTN